MNLDRAREFFSDYFEGTLDAGLRQAFERNLEASEALREEYAEFCLARALVEELRDEEIEVPISLSDRIATRLEEAQSAKAKRSWFDFGWIRGLGFAGVAALAILGGVLALNRSGGPATASALPSAAPVQPLAFEASSEGVVLTFASRQEATVEIEDAVSGKTIQEIQLKGRPLRSPLKNGRSDTFLFRIKATGEELAWLVAVPGSTREIDVAEGSGTVGEYAKALAGHFRLPVLVRVADPEKTVNWKLQGTDAFAAAQETSQVAGFTVERMPDGLLRLQDR